ncbi:Ig-like domain-containing protein [Flavicella sediminum]|uniref:Ig-like domain-containing protein n=1 Tax=Flavicella sediminum TaxID=2585141 RepID=UPI0011221048|nr:Ig-like domain-containing protein [Flavicella sediminum]
MKNLIAFLLIASVIVGSTTRCARRGSPNGGPKDSLSPVMVTAEPEYKATYFNAKRIKLSFDEYVKFKDLFKQLIISPPLKYAPIIKPLGSPSKLITIDLLDTLKENTTYSINFGNSIVDNNEGNKLGSFKYVFSTGSYVDSLEVSGAIKNAFEMKPVENIAVLLYEVNEDYTDSIVYKEKPIYVSNTLDTTSFNITNIKPGIYQLIALKDFNNNFIYNPKQDKIGFLNHPIQLPTDSTYQLNLFKEKLDFKLLKPLENKVGKIIFGYEGSPKSLDIQLLSETPDDFRSLLNKDIETDTLNYWYTPFDADSLQFQVKTDLLDTIYTVQLRTSKIDSLLLSTTLKGTLHPKDTFAITTNIPIDSLNNSQITIIDKDTLAVPFETFIDKNKTKLSIYFDRSRNENFQIDILPHLFVSFQGETNDTLQYQLKTLDIEDYATLEIGLKNIKKFPVLVDLITTKGELVERQYSNEKTNFVFNDITPNSYLIRVIFDSNNNKKWDSGNFLEKIQPENVVYFRKELKLRANWTVNEVLDINKPTLPKQDLDIPKAPRR